MALPDIKYFLGIGENPTEPKIHLSQFDTGNTFRVFLVSHGHFVGIDNDVSAVIVGRKPDGTAYTYNCEVSSSQTAVIVPVKEEMTAVVGNTEAEIVLTCANGRRAGTCNFIIAVEESPVEGVTVSQTDLEAVYQAVTLAADVRQTQTEIENTQTTLEAMQDALAGMQAELREALENMPVVVPVRIPSYVISKAIAASRTSGTSEQVDPTKVTTTEDPETLYNAVDLARRTGKPVRFDLGVSAGAIVLDASVMRVSMLYGSQEKTRLGAYFTHADLNFSANMAGLARLEVSVVKEYTDNGTVYSVAAYVTAEANNV